MGWTRVLSGLGVACVLWFLSEMIYSYTACINLVPVIRQNARKGLEEAVMN